MKELLPSPTPVRSTASQFILAGKCLPSGTSCRGVDMKKALIAMGRWGEYAYIDTSGYLQLDRIDLIMFCKQ